MIFSLLIWNRYNIAYATIYFQLHETVGFTYSLVM